MTRHPGRSRPAAPPPRSPTPSSLTGDWATEAITDTAIPLTSTKAYTYDNGDRLSSVQDTLEGQCTTRAYAYDADSDRTNLISYPPGTAGACQDTTGTTTTETYDSANRVTNAGYAYDTQGDVTTTPSADAGGTGALTATYDANDMLASQTQNGDTMTWALDPIQGRFTSYTQSGVTCTNHYSDDGSDPTWTGSSSGGWTRNVDGIDGLVAAEVTASGGVTLELADLHGDIMASATTSTTATGPSATNVYGEFGTTETGTPGGYGWLGVNQVSSNSLGGQLLMGVRSYNAATGRFSQPDPVPGGSANSYDYSNQDPVDQFDLSGQFAAVRTCSVSWGWSFHAECTFYVTRSETRLLGQDYSDAGLVGGAVLDVGVCSRIPGPAYIKAACMTIGFAEDWHVMHEVNFANSFGGCLTVTISVSWFLYIGPPFIGVNVGAASRRRGACQP